MKAHFPAPSDFRLFPPANVPNVSGFVTELGPAFSNSLSEPLAPFEIFSIASSDAHTFGPDFGARPEHERHSADQIIDRVELNYTAKNQVRTPLPDGRSSRTYLATLKELEQHAKSAGLGGWRH